MVNDSARGRRSRSTRARDANESFANDAKDVREDVDDGAILREFDLGDERAPSMSSSRESTTTTTSTSMVSAETRTLDEEFTSLVRARLAALAEATKKRWNEGAATPKVAFDLGRDYVRRVAVAYPYAVVGSARGDVALCDVSKSSALAISPAAHRRDWSEVEDRPLGERVLLGQYDGGAVTAVAISLTNRRGDDFARVASGGRDGAVHLYKAATNSAALIELGRAQHDGVITGIAFARGSLWSTALDGKLCRWSPLPLPVSVAAMENTRSLTKDAAEYANVSAPQLAKQGEWRSGQPTLCLSSCEKTGVVAIGNADGTAAILSADATSYDSSRSSQMLAWQAYEGGTVRSIAICPGNGVVTGGGDGVIRVWRMCSTPPSPAFDALEKRFDARSLKPKLVAELRGHTGAVVALSCGCDGRLVSGAQDGTIRVWDLDLTTSKPGEKIRAIRRDARYAVLGHTVWLGSTYADADRIICDGANNVLLEYDFTAKTDDANATM